VFVCNIKYELSLRLEDLNYKIILSKEIYGIQKELSKIIFIVLHCKILIPNSFLTFTETDVISMEKELVVSEGPAVLKCYSVPLGIPLEYCRFIRPDGKGFSVDAQNK
jgi:hypothetical protein